MATSTFSTLTTVRLGIYAAQKGLDVTGNNITNINTTGYTRQALEQQSLVSSVADKYFNPSDPRIGQGVYVSGVTQLRDPALDITYRNAMADVGAMDAKLAGLESLASILDEVGKGGLDQDDGVILRQLNDLRDVINRANTDGIEGYDGIIRTSAQALTSLFNSYSSKLNELNSTYEEYLDQDVDTVNSMLSEIQKLNVTIRHAEIRGDDALELKDQRNMMLDSLSQFAKINVSYSTETLAAGFEVEKISVQLIDEDRKDIPGGLLIDGVNAAQLSVDEANNYLVTVEQMKDPDGVVVAGSTATELDDNELYGSLQSIREILTEKGGFATAADVAIDPNAVSKMGIPYYQQALDMLANEFATLMNDINNQGTGVPGEGALFSNGSNSDDTTGITAGNIAVSKSWASGAVEVVSSSDPDASSGDNTNLAQLLNVFSATHSFDPDNIVVGAEGEAFSGTLEDMLFNIQSTLAEDQMSTTTVLTNYAITAENVYVSRDSVMGVDLNDEATYLMTYQKAYSAAARLMTIFDEVLETLLRT